jgi:hypothetical protein
VTLEQTLHKWIAVDQAGRIPPDTDRLDVHCGVVARDPRSNSINPVCVLIDDIRLVPLDDETAAAP